MIVTRTKVLTATPGTGSNDTIRLPVCILVGAVIFLDWVGGTVAAADKCVAEIRTFNSAQILDVGTSDVNNLMVGAINVPFYGSTQGCGTLMPIGLRIDYPTDIFLYMNALAGSVGTWYGNFQLVIQTP